MSEKCVPPFEVDSTARDVAGESWDLPTFVSQVSQERTPVLEGLGAVITGVPTCSHMNMS
jgi:hypothetical protein